LRNLIDFIIKNIHWLLFIILFSLSIILINKHQEFQRSKYLSVTREVTGSLYSLTNTFRSYLNLKSQNAEYSNKIAELYTEIEAYRLLLASQNDSIQTIRYNTSDTALVFRFIPAKVVNSSVNRIENYITLNKGSLDNIRSDMGVISANGIVGVVMQTSPHYATVISVLNPQFQLSGKIKRSNYSGPLVWDGKDSRYTYLTKIPQHAIVLQGDTIITSGFSSVFPAGLPVGVVADSIHANDDLYHSIRVRLFADLANLHEAMIVENTRQKEQWNLENQIK